MLMVYDHRRLQKALFRGFHREEDGDTDALQGQGMTISGIARRTNHDRNCDCDCDCETIRSYRAGDRAPVVRNRVVSDTSNRFVDSVAVKLSEESRPLGFTGSYPTLTSQVLDRSLRQVC